jgi:hypothetical protein
MRSPLAVFLTVALAFLWNSKSHAESGFGLKVGLGFSTRAYEECMAQKAALAHAVCELDEDVAAKSRTISSLHHQLATCRATVADLGRQLRQKDQELKTKQQEIERLTKELAVAEDALEKTRTELAETKTLLSACEKRKAELEKALQDLNEKYVTSIEEKGKLSGELAQMTIERDRYKADAEKSAHHLGFWRCLAWILVVCLVVGLVLLILALFRWHHYKHHHWDLHRREDDARDEIASLREKLVESERKNGLLVTENAEARRQHERDLEAINKLSSDCAGTKSELAAVKDQARDLKSANTQLSHWLDQCKHDKCNSEKETAVALANALSATREMAARGHHHCCSSHNSAPSVVYGPGPTYGPYGPGPTYGHNDSSGFVTPSNSPMAVPSNSTPSNSTPSNNTPSNNTPSNNTPSNNTPSNNTPSNNTPSNNTPSNNTPSNNTPSTTSSSSTPSSPDGGEGGIFGDLLSVIPAIAAI